MSDKQLLPEQPKPKAEVKTVLADKVKATNEGQVIKK